MLKSLSPESTGELFHWWKVDVGLTDRVEVVGEHAQCDTSDDFGDGAVVEPRLAEDGNTMIP